MTDLTTEAGCRQEMQDCSRGLAYLDHLFARALEDKASAEALWENVEARAAKEVRSNLRSGATATEVRGAITEYINERLPDAEARDHAREAGRTLEKIERFMRSLEKRLSGAQTAAKGHEALGRYGGGDDH